jgi:Protein of unknown function (DUF3301)
MLSWTLLVAVIAALIVGWFWHDSLKQRERANVAAQQACERASLQFLDGTVAFTQLKVYRADSGRLALRRTYVFDYTARSIERQQGFVVLAGERVETVGFATTTPTPQPTPRHDIVEPEERPSLTHNDALRQPSNVLDLEEWRRQRQQASPPDQPRRSDSGDRRV